MSGKRITIRRTAGIVSSPVEETDKKETGDSVFAEEARESVARMVRGATLSRLLRDFIYSPTVGGTITGRLSSTTPEMQELPGTQVHDSVVIGVDHAVSGRDRTEFTLSSPQQAERGLGGAGYTTSTSVPATYAPALEVQRMPYNMTTEISLRIYLCGPSAPPSYCTASFRDEEFIDLRGTHRQPQEIREEIVRRLLSAMNEELRLILIHALEEATRKDEGFRREVWRITGGDR